MIKTDTLLTAQLSFSWILHVLINYKDNYSKWPLGIHHLFFR